MRPTRRELLRLAWLGLALFPGRAAARWPDARLDACLRLFPEPAGAGLVGRAYLDRVPAERDAERLLELLAIPQTLLRSGATQRLHRWVWERIRDDFEAGRTVEVGGWILAQTEARLCGLVTTTRPRA